MGIRVTVRNGNEKEWELTAWECEGMGIRVTVGNENEKE